MREPWDKVRSSVDIHDSNEFVKRAELVWAKAYEFESKVRALSQLYGEKQWIYTRHRTRFDPGDVDKEKSDINTGIERQRASVEAALNEFYDVAGANEYYLGNNVTLPIAYYVAWAYRLVEGEELADDLEKETATFERNVEQWAKDTEKRITQSLVDALVRKHPGLQEPEAQARLAAVLQEAEREQQRDSDAMKKEREEKIRSVRERAAANRTFIEEQMRKLRFDAAAARRYSLKHQPNITDTAMTHKELYRMYIQDVKNEFRGD
jgi:hypothetical protein